MTSLAALNTNSNSSYGAIEIKEQIRKYTYKGFAYAVGILVLFLIITFVNEKINSSSRVKRLPPIVKLDLVNLAPEEEEAPPPPPPPEINNGPMARAGTPVAVPDADIRPDMQEFASMDDINRASAEGGNGVDLGGFASNIDFDANSRVNVTQREVEPDPDEFQAVEKDVGVDIAALQKLVEYPAMARKAGVEGKVIVKALINKDGRVLKSRIDYTDNIMLNKAAEEAVKNYKNFTPAIQNKQPVQCWISIPIVFKLR